MRMVLHDPGRIKKCLIALSRWAWGVLSNALKTVSQVRSGQAGNIARAEVQRCRGAEVQRCRILKWSNHWHLELFYLSGLASLLLTTDAPCEALRRSIAVDVVLAESSSCIDETMVFRARAGCIRNCFKQLYIDYLIKVE
jgi:hypothetical protein